MASRSSDIVARLALNAESFSAENARAFGEMEKRASDTAARMKSSFDASFAEVQAMAKRALDLPRTDTGALNLDSASIKAAAAAAQNEAQALREIATAARQAADATGDTSTETRLYVQAAAAAAREAEENVRSLNGQAAALDRLQAELNQTSSSTRALVIHQGHMERGARNNQLAMRNLGFQLSDVGASLASGGSLFVIFGQQIGQVGGALSDMSGRAGAVGRFLTNPWVAALTTAGIVLGMFYERLEDTSDALDKTKFASDQLGSAQSILGSVMDLTTGKIREQAKELVALAIAQAKVAAIQARARADTARSEILALQSPTNEFSGGMGGGFSVTRKDAGARGVISQQVLSGELDAATAVERLDGLRKAGAMTDEAFASAAASVTALGTELRNLKEYEGTERLLKGAGTAADRALLLRPKTTKPKDNSRAIAARDEFGRDSADRIVDIASRFGGDASRVQQVEKAVRDLDDIIDDLSRRRPPNFEETIKSAEQAKIVVRESLDRPLRDLVDRAREREQIDALVVQGRYAEADALSQVLALERQMGPLNEQQLAKVLEIAKADEVRSRAIEDQRRQVGLYVQAIGDVQGATERLLSGGTVKEFGSNLLASFKSLQARIISEGIFGGLDRKIEDFVTGRTGVEQANQFLSSQTTVAGNELKSFADVVAQVRGDIGSGRIVAAGGATSNLAGSMAALFKDDGFLADLKAEQPDVVTGSGGADGEIVVTARKQAEAANDNTKALIGATDAYNFIGQSIVARLKSFGIDIPDAIGKKFGDVLQGASLGVAGSSLAGTVFGGKQSSLGGALGGAAGKELLGDAVGKGLGAISSKLAGLGGPIAGIIGGMAGSLIGGMLAKPKYGTAAISMNQYGELTANVTSGRGSAQKAAAKGAAGHVINGIEDVADQLDAEITGVPNITIGTYKDKYRVSTAGYTGKLDFKGQSAVGLYDFGKNGAEDAVAFAIQKSIEGGVITGISQASINILKSGQDLQKALQKAVLIESVPKELQKRLDPVGYALDEVNDRFKKIVEALREGGATAEQMADAQKLYNLELAEAKSSAGEASEALKDFLRSLNAGSSSPLSLRDQEANARAVLDPYLGQIARGESIDQEKYQSAAQTFLDIERQLYGSTAKYFEAFDMIQGATGNAIATIDNAAPIRTTSDPFNETTATASQATAANTANTNTLLQQLIAQNQQLLSLWGPSLGFVGTGRSYV